MRSTYDDKLSRLDITLECDGQTDGQNCYINIYDTSALLCCAEV